MDEKQTIRFRDLSGGLKIGIVTAYFIGILYILSFVVGFIIGLTEVI